VRPATERELVLSFDDGPFGPDPVVVRVPPVSSATQRFPVLVAFHGRGEALKAPLRGARGWLDDYGLGNAEERLRHPPLTRRDFLGMVTDERLRQLNAEVSARPYDGLVIVCPYLPDVLHGAAAFRQAAPLAEFIVERVLPRVRRETPASDVVGIDGVSLGGRAALLVGLTRPKAFAAIGALQPALDTEEIGRFVDLARRATRENPRLRLRLLTSDEDYFRLPVHALADAWKRAGVRATLDDVVGTHSYEFNRGPGGFEMLLYHRTALAR
jgi:enterochelin esterase-like enzyme